ncbi:hypothetical protein A6U85_25320 [Agrobacterium sp. 13-626]|nr:hypothetical protein A6U85_25320 [Agrobacterium sp. 13-626]
MFLYFPENYMWSLSVLRAIAAGGDFGEIDLACQSLKAAAQRPPQGDLEAWHAAWMTLAERVENVGREAADSNHRQTAHEALLRAAIYYQWAEAFLDPSDPRAKSVFGRHLDAFRKSAQLRAAPLEFLDIPFEGSSLPAYYVPAAGRDPGRPGPVAVLSGGLDSTNEELYPVAAVLSARGISCLGVDWPGQGAALRIGGHKARHDTETAASACFDYLAGRPDVDIARVGLVAPSLGGYNAPRAVAFEKRFKACVAWGAIYDYHAIWRNRLNIGGDEPSTLNRAAAISTTGKHLLHILGASDFDDALHRLEPFTLAGIAGQIECDFLLVHGEDDRQTSLAQAEQLFEEVGSKRKQMRVYTREEGGSAHVQLDIQGPARNFLADWLADRL